MSSNLDLLSSQTATKNLQSATRKIDIYRLKHCSNILISLLHYPIRTTHTGYNIYKKAKGSRICQLGKEGGKGGEGQAAVAAVAEKAEAEAANFCTTTGQQ